MWLSCGFDDLNLFDLFIIIVFLYIVSFILPDAAIVLVVEEEEGEEVVVLPYIHWEEGGQSVG